MSRWTLGWLVALAAAGLLGLSMVVMFPTKASTFPIQKKHENYKLLVDALEEIQAKYAKELTPDEVRKLIEDMINGGLRQLDQHSHFYNQDDFKDFQAQSDGKFVGVGIQLGVNKFDQLYVISPIVGTPAFDAGVMAGDLIIKIDDKTTEKMDVEEAKRRIVGEPNTQVRLTVVHEGDKKPRELTIMRKEIHIDSVLGSARSKVNLKDWDFMVDAKLKIAHVRVINFTKDTTAEMIKVVEALEALGMQGLIIDLRNNPGGLLKTAVELSSMFLPEGKHVVTTKGRGKTEEHVYNSRPPVPGFKPRTVEQFPIAILINRGSASASEILAAAIQDHARGKVIGERSYGKGSVQNMIGMEGGASALKITTAIYWRPSGRNIHRFKPAWDEEDVDTWGVKPDDGLKVKLTDEEFRDWMLWRRDRDIVRAGPPKEEGKDPKKKEVTDKVLDKALEYLRGELGKRAEAGAAIPAATTADATPLLPTLPALTPEGRADAGRAGRVPGLLNRGMVVR